MEDCRAAEIRMGHDVGAVERAMEGEVCQTKRSSVIIITAINYLIPTSTTTTIITNIANIAVIPNPENVNVDVDVSATPPPSPGRNNGE